MAAFDPGRLAQVGASRMDVTGYRNQAPGFDPRSGEGARRFGGRFNPPNSFAVLYLCSTRACAASEFHRQAQRQSIDIERLLPRELWVVDIRLRRVLDLTSPKSLESLDIAGEDLTRDDHGFTQDIGKWAHEYRFQTIRTPSATGTGEVFAILLDHVAGPALKVALLETWSVLADLDNR